LILEHVMTIEGTFRRSLMLTAMVTAVSLGGALGATAETDVYKDVRMPNGHARSMAAKRADMRACGAVNGKVSAKDFPKADACMQSHGWVIDHIVPDRGTLAQRKPAASGGQEKTWQEIDDDGVLVNCKSILGGFGSICTNF
jgi:hypothetical protein